MRSWSAPGNSLGARATTPENSAPAGTIWRKTAAKQSEKDRYIRLYAQGHISDTELETYLADLKNQNAELG